MKKAALTALMAVVIVACAQAGEDRAAPQDPPGQQDEAPGFRCPDPVTIEYTIKGDGVYRQNKATDPVPGFARNCPFYVKTNWEGADTQTLTLGSFKAVDYLGAGNDKWGDEESRQIELSDGTKVDSVTLDTSTDMHGPYTLPSMKTVGAGKPRLILFAMTLKTASGESVTFDPPWSEKKRGGG